MIFQLGELVVVDPVIPYAFPVTVNGEDISMERDAVRYIRPGEPGVVVNYLLATSMYIVLLPAGYFFFTEEELKAIK